MFIKQITLDGVHEDVELARTDDGVLATMGNIVLTHYKRMAAESDRRTSASVIATALAGTDREGLSLATERMRQDVADLIAVMTK